jgi:hypothetical protein
MIRITAIITSGTRVKWFITISGLMKLIAIPIAISANYLRKNRKNTSAGGIATGITIMSTTITRL